MTAELGTAVLTARRTAQHIRLSESNDAYEHLCILTLTTKPRPVSALCWQIHPLLAVRVPPLRVWVHCPRASNGLLPRRSNLVGYVRWDERSNQSSFQTINSNSFTRSQPSGILLCHLCDEFADVLRNSWPTSLRLPFPKQLETLASQPIKVSGLTMTKASFQSQRRDQRMRQTRAESFNRLGWACPPRSGLCASGTEDGRKEVRPRPDR